MLTQIAIGQYDDNGLEMKGLVRSEMQLAGRKMNNARRGLADYGYDVKYYKCRWKIDPAVNFIQGQVTMYFVATKEISAVGLDMASTLNEKIVMAGTATADYSRSDTSILINFLQPIAAGKLDSVSIAYEGVPFNSGFGSFATGRHNNVPVMWTLSEPYGAMDWWPCKNVMNDKADSLDVWLSYPANYTGVGNGMSVAEAVSGNTKTTHWQHRYPIATYLISVAITNYELQVDSVAITSSTLPMYSYFYPEGRAAFTKTSHTLGAIHYFDSLLTDYPFAREKYGHVQFGWSGGMEHQTNSFMFNLDRMLVAHELAHQWFGDKVTANSWQDIWLQEGLATYCAYLENTRNDTAAIRLEREGMQFVITAAPGGAVWVNDTSNVGRIFDLRLSYYKGAYLCIMLEHLLGREVFFEGLRNYLNDEDLAYANATTADLQRHLEAVSGKQLTRFFDQWFRGEGYPSFNIEWSQNSVGLVNLNIKHTTSHSSVSDFNVPLPVVFVSGSQRDTVVFDVQGVNQTFLRTFANKIDTILIDPALTLLSKNNTATKVDAPIVETETQIDIVNPFDAQLVINFINQENDNVAISIFDAAGRLMHRSTNAVNGTTVVTVNTATWASGVYYLKVKGEKINFTKTLLK